MGPKQKKEGGKCVRNNWLENPMHSILNVVRNKSEKGRGRMKLRINTAKERDHLN